MGLGVPFNMSQYAVLQQLVAHATGLQAGQFIHYMHNVHIYENHFEALRKQICREPLPNTAKLWINPSVRDFNDFTPADVKLLDYKSHPNIPMEVAV